MMAAAVSCLTLLAILLIPVLVVSWHKVRDAWNEITRDLP